MCQLKAVTSHAGSTERGSAEAGAASAGRFGARYNDPKFRFMWPSQIRDAHSRRPDDPKYDPSTVHIEDKWYKDNKISEGQKQWWQFKADHWDSVVLFKVGKCAPALQCMRKHCTRASCQAAEHAALLDLL